MFGLGRKFHKTCDRDEKFLGFIIVDKALVIFCFRSTIFLTRFCFFINFHKEQEIVPKDLSAGTKKYIIELESLEKSLDKGRTTKK